MPAACWIVWNASQVGMQTHSYASRVARNGRLEIGPFIRLSWLRTFQGHAHGSSPTSSFLLCSLFVDALGLPHGAYFPRPRE